MSDRAYECSAPFRSHLAPQLASYVEYKVNVGGCAPESFLPTLTLFDRHCAGLRAEEPGRLSREAVHSYLGSKDVKASTLRRNESVLRSLGTYLATVLHAEDAYVLPRTVVRRAGRTFVPHVFSEDEVRRLFRAADQYDPRVRSGTVNLANSMRCMVKTLYCTGMRVSEACRLGVGEVDMADRVIHADHAKNDNRRIVTISGSLAEELGRYLAESEGRRTSGAYFFDSGSPLHDGLVSPKRAYAYFRRYLEIAGIEHGGVGVGPRLHDLRVTFAVRSLQRLTAESEDVNASLAYLSAFMGHQSLRETQEYLWMDGDLFAGTLARMDEDESFISGIFREKAGEDDD